MSDEMKKVLEEYLKLLLATLQDGASFAADQVPLIIQEKLAYDFWVAAGWSIATLIAIAAVWLVRRVYVHTLGEDLDDDDRLGSLLACAIASVILAIIFLPINIGIMMKISLAPRLYIIEWLLSTVK